MWTVETKAAEYFADFLSSLCLFRSMDASVSARSAGTSAPLELQLRSLPWWLVCIFFAGKARRYLAVILLHLRISLRREGCGRHIDSCLQGVPLEQRCCCGGRARTQEERDKNGK